MVALLPLVAGCQQSPNRARTAVGDIEDASPEAEKYCRFGHAFVAALLNEEYDNAHQMCCAPLRLRVSRQGFE